MEPRRVVATNQVVGNEGGHVTVYEILGFQLSFVVNGLIIVG